MTEHSAETTPWYRQFWPWFLIALPASVVVAGITTVIIATRGADSLVRDDYYKDGLAINQQLQQDRVAEDLALRAALRVDPVVGEVLVRLEGASPDQLTLLLIHPLESHRDQTLLCRHRGGADFLCALTRELKGRWYLELRAETPRPWRLKGERDFDQGHSLWLSAQP